MSTTRTGTRRTLAVEALESRVALSGNVSAFVNRDGDLIVRGDDASNSVTVNRTGGPGSPIQVTGHAGTAINGVPDGVAVIGSVLNIDVKLGAGDDGILVNSVDVPGAVRVKLGEGDDSGTLDGVLGGLVEVRGGDGSDLIEFSKGSVVFGNVRVVAGDGDDDILFRVTEIRGDLDIAGGGGDDVTDLFHVALTGDTRIQAADGHDDLFLDLVTVGGATDISLGSGDDSLYLGSSTFSGLFSAGGGDGTDDIEDAGGNSFADAVFAGFES